MMYSIKLRTINSILLKLLFSFIYCFVFIKEVSAATYYLSDSGNDSNNGTSQSTSWKTFGKVIPLLNAGDTLYIGGGTYLGGFDINRQGTAERHITIQSLDSTPVVIDAQNRKNYVIRISGSYIDFKGSNIKIVNSSWAGIDMTGDHLLVDGPTVTDIESHGIVSSGNNITVRNTIIYNTVLENENYDSGFGSALKVFHGAENILYEYNRVYHNYGEGIASTRGKNIIIRNNRVYDNYSVNLYIDNSRDVVLENNFATCDVDSTARKYYRGGNPATGIALAEEYYSGWGNQLNNILVKNNIVSGCGGIVYWGADSGSGGLRQVKILNNTIYNTYNSPIVIEREDGTEGSEIAFNIFHSSIGRSPWIENHGVSNHHNFWVGSMPDINFRGENALSGDPLFNNTPNLSSVNSYRLGTNSPAIGRGADPLFVTTTSTSYNPSPTPVYTIAPTPGYCPSDIDRNYVVGGSDAQRVLTRLGTTCLGCTEDINTDGVINTIDYLQVQRVWGNCSL